MNAANKSSSVSSARKDRTSVGIQSFITLILIMAILGMVNYLGFKYYNHKDLTPSQFYTLSSKTIEVLNKLDAPVTATILFSRMVQTDQERELMVDTLLKEYQHRGGKNFVVDRIDPTMDVAQAMELKKRLQFDANTNLIILEYKKQVKFLNLDDLFTAPQQYESGVGNFKAEQVITSNLVNMVEGKSAKVYFTQGHLERDVEGMKPNDCGWFSESMKRDGIEIHKLSLASVGDVPDDADAVVIISPSVSFSAQEADAIGRYLEKNGKLILFAEPSTTTGLEDVLKKYGIQLDNDTVLYRVPTTAGLVTLPLALVTASGVSTTHEITAKIATEQIDYTKFYNMRSLSILNNDKGQPNSKVAPLLTVADKGWGTTKPMPSTEEAAQQMKNLLPDPKTDLMGPLYIALAYDGGSTTGSDAAKSNGHATRVVVMGGSLFLSNQVGDSYGYELFSLALDWMVKKNPVLDIEPKIPQEYGLTISPIQGRTIFIFAFFIVPGIPLLLGIITWISRLK